jgi:hypothetical protein
MTDFPNIISEAFFVQFSNRRENASFRKKRKSKKVDGKS